MYRFIMIASLAFLWAGTSHASIINDFTGPYSASNWSKTSTGGGITVNESDPAKLIFTITGTVTPRFNDDSFMSYETTIAGTGMLSFDWETGGHILEHPAPFIQIQFFSSPIPPQQSFIEGMTDSLQDKSGHLDFSVTEGQSFGFTILSAGFSIGDDFRFSISRFSAPVTEPSVLLLFGLGLIGLVTQRRKA